MQTQWIMILQIVLQRGRKFCKLLKMCNNGIKNYSPQFPHTGKYIIAWRQKCPPAKEVNVTACFNDKSGLYFWIKHAIEQPSFGLCSNSLLFLMCNTWYRILDLTGTKKLHFQTYGLVSLPFSEPNAFCSAPITPRKWLHQLLLRAIFFPEEYCFGINAYKSISLLAIVEETIQLPGLKTRAFYPNRTWS